MANKFWIGGTATWDNTNDLNWSLSTGGPNNTTHPVAGDNVTFDGASGGGTVTVNATLAFNQFVTSAYTGTLDFSTNNNSITIGSWVDAATGVHTTNMGNGTWTFTLATGTPINLTTGANHTLNANGSTVLLSAVPTGIRTLSFQNRTLNNITVTNAAWQPYAVIIAGFGGAIGGALVCTNVGLVQFTQNQAITVTGAITLDGSSTNQAILTSTAGTAATLTVAAANTLSWLTVQNITKAGAGSITVNNGFDGGGNTGVTINMPQRLLGGGMSGGMRG